MELTGIAIFYFVCLAAGFLFALIGAVFGELGCHGGLEAGEHELSLDHSGVEVGDHSLELGHDGDIGHDVGHGGHDVEASVFNTITISVFIAFLGLSGLFSVYVLGLTGLPSLLFAVPVAVVSASVQFVLYVRLFIRAQASSEATMAEVLGCEADVITGIPADRVGEIAYVIKGTRYTGPAMSADGQELPRGSRVRVVNLRGTVLVVRLI